MTVLLATVLAASLVAAITDVRSRRIPNWLVAGLAIAGLLENALFAGGRGVLADVAVTAGVLALGTVAFSFRLIAGGDVKLLAAAAGALGFPLGVWFVLLALLSGGVLGVVYAAIRGRLARTFVNLRTIALPIFAGAPPLRIQSGLHMPYALAIFSGAVSTAILSGLWPHLRLIQ